MAGLKDIAEITGLSINTVSRALRGNGYVSENALKKVRAAAATLGYTPNRAARSLRFNRNFEIAVLVFIDKDPNAKSDELNMDKIIGIKNFLSSHDYDMNIHFAFSEYGYTANGQREMKNILLTKPAGVIIIGNGSQQLGMAADCVVANLPVVLISYSRIPDLNCVYIDREHGVMDSVSYLYRLGKRQIVFAGSKQCVGRTAGYRKGIAMHGLTEHLIPVYDYAKDGLAGIVQRGIETARIILEQVPDVDAIQAYSDYLAAGLSQGLRANGKRIPDDIAIVGFDDRQLALFVTPPLTTLAQPNAEAGRLAAELVLRLIDHAPSTTEAIKVPMNLIIRKSTE